MEKESKQKMETIDDEIHLAKEKSKTDAEFYRVGQGLIGRVCFSLGRFGFGFGYG